MSAADLLANAELLSTQINFSRYALTASFALQVYEWLANLQSEFQLIHGGRSHWSWIRVAYILCRYYPLIAYPIILWAYLQDFSSQECMRIVHPVHALFAPFNFFGPAVMFLRAYAFTGKKLHILFALSFCYMLLIGVDTWVFWAQVQVFPDVWYEVFGETGCFPDYGTGVMGLRVGIVMMTATFMDLVSLFVIVMHCRSVIRSKWALARYFVAQGLGSFLFLLLVNATAAIMYFQPNDKYSRVGLPFIFAMNGIIACRVILHLREKALQLEEQLTSGPFSTSTTTGSKDPIVLSDPNMSLSYHQIRTIPAANRCDWVIGELDNLTP